MKIHSARSGQTLVEFALALPLILLLFFGALELGKLSFDFITITHAVREGARYAIINPSDSAGISSLVISSSPGVPSGQLSISTTQSSGWITVSIDYDWIPMTPIGTLLTGGAPSYIIHTQSSMHIE
jgi:Flp pilus assembly protein TadG